MSLTLAAKIIIVIALIVAWCRIAITGGSIKKRWLPIAIAVYLGWNILAPVIFHASTYGGNVVDEDTDDPIAGAVVTVIWYDSQIIHMAQTRHFQTATETVTGSDGRFSLWNWPGISLNPITYVLTPPDVIIYKAGYMPRRTSTEYTGANKKLRKLRTKEEIMMAANPGVGSDVPNYRIPKLIGEVNVHRKNIGLVSQIP